MGNHLVLVLAIWITFWLPTALCAEAPKWVTAAIDSAKSATYHADASRVTLLHSVASEVGAGGIIHQKIRMIVKVLKSEGSNAAALVEPVFPERQVTNIKGWVVFSNGEDRTITKDEIGTVALPQASGMYDDMRELIVLPKDLAQGSTAAYEYEVVEKDGWNGVLDGMIFQVQEPVRLASYSLRLPDGWTLHQSLQYADGCVYTDSNGVHQWVMRDLAYRPEESYMPEWSQVTRRLTVGCGNPAETKVPNFDSWQAVAAWYKQLFEKPSTADTTVATLAFERAKGQESELTKMRALADFVRSEVRYVAVEMGRGRITPRDASVTLGNRYGDCKDKAALARAILAPIGITAVPVLASSKNRACSEVPSPLQFDHCIVAIPREQASWIDTTAPAFGDGWLYFDPTADWLPLGHLPLQLYGTKILNTGAADRRLGSLPALSPELNRRHYSIIATLSATGSVVADVHISYLGTRAYNAAKYHTTTPVSEQVDGFLAAVSHAAPGAAISDYKYGREGDSAWATCRITTDQYLSHSGELALMTLDPLHSEPRKLLKVGKREHPIWFGEASAVDIDITWQLDSTWQVDGQYPPVEIDGQGLTVAADISVEGQVVRYHLTSRQDGRLIPVEQYEAARSIRRVLDDSFRMRLALRGRL